jgi:hypothetical protein
MSRVARKFGGVVGLALASMLVASSSMGATIGQKRCLTLDTQLSGVVQNSKQPAPKSVGTLSDKARSLCTKGKTAQGLRTYAKALKIMGSQPALPKD